MGTLYLAHFAEKIGDPSRPRMHAQHYCGYAEPWHFEARVKQHLEGRGARITRFVASQGIGMVFFKIASGKHITRAEERRIKRGGHYNKLCPICQALRKNPQALDEPPF